MADLQDFLAKYADADEAPEVLLQLASANEFNGEEDEAHKQYAKVVEAYPGTEAAKKAAGSLRRLDLVGKSLVLKGTGLQNEVDRHGAVPRQDGPGRLLGELGHARSRPSCPSSRRSPRSIATAGWRSSA